MGILTRFVIRTCIAPFLFSFSVITGLLFLNAVAQRLEDLTGKGLDWRTIVDFMALSLPHTVALTLPMATLVAVLYAFSELSAHNEFTAMKAGGVRPQRLLLPLLGIGLVLAEVMFFFNDQVLPEANHRLKDLLVDLSRKSPTFELREQVVNEIQAADGLNPVYLTATHIDNVHNQLENVVIYDSESSGSHRTTYADSGSMAFNPARTDLFLTLHEGTVLETDSDHPGAFRQLSFHKQIVPLRGVGNELNRRAAEGDRGDREMTVEMLKDEIELRRREIVSVGAESVQQSRNVVLSALKHLPEKPPSTGAISGVQRTYAVNFESDPLVDDAAVNARSAKAHKDALSQRINQFAVEIYKKFALSFACVVFVLIGAPIAVRYPRGGLGLVIAASSGIFAISWIGLIGGENLADRGIAPPGIAMWAPNILFLILGLWLVARMGREEATMRGGGWEEILWTIRSKLPFGRSEKSAS
jgi:lipopolysaccharide export system permease protein